MRRRLTALLAVVVVTVTVGAAPVLAAQGGEPTQGSCGIGEAFSADLREDDFNYKKEKISPKPGGGEASELHPTNCPGSD